MDKKSMSGQANDCESSYDSDTDDSESGFTTTDEDDFSTQEDSQSAHGDCSKSQVNQAENEVASQGQSSANSNSVLSTTLPGVSFANRSISVQVVQKNKNQLENTRESPQEGSTGGATQD